MNIKVIIIEKDGESYTQRMPACSDNQNTSFEARRVQEPSKVRRPTFFVGNHVSYLDIPVIGSYLPVYFIAKQDVAGWPFFGWLTRLQKTIFIARKLSGLREAGDVIISHLNAGNDLVVFPEGTSSDGSKVLPFRSSLFSIFFDQRLDRQIEIQPFTINIHSDLRKSCPDKKAYDFYPWHGEMSLIPHLWRFACSKGTVVELIFHEKTVPEHFQDRKEITGFLHDKVSQGLTAPQEYGMSLEE